jgi:tRNA threonylcarbamoyladenosine biosynthesis protein TsaB
MQLAIKTAEEVTELYVVVNDKITARKKWPAGRNLAKDLLAEISQLVDGQFAKLSGLVVFAGPGSFTGLRIGIATLNAIAYAEQIPIVGTSGENWLKSGLAALKKGHNDKIVIPKYGAPANITAPKR